MTAVGGLVLLGLLVSAHCEVRARDPEVQEEQEELGGRLGGGGGFPQNLEGLHPEETEAPLVEAEGNYPARSGNWCAFVQRRVETRAVACGTEQYTIRSQSRCPSGSRDCQLVMYKLSTRPTYRQQQQMVTALLWRCCPGHRGRNCEDSVADAQLDSGSSSLIGGSEVVRPELRPAGVSQQQRVDPNREQNDQQVSAGGNTSGHAHNPRSHFHPQETLQLADSLHPDTLAPLPVPDMMALLMSQLQPFLQGFNRSLEHLSRQVWDLARDVAELKSSHLGAELGVGPADGAEPETPEEELLDAKVEEVMAQVRDVQLQLESQRMHLESSLHSQHAMLHYNLTTFKTDVDTKLKRHQKMLQISLQAMNATLTELKLDQEQNQDQDQDLDQDPEVLHPVEPPQLLDTSALWKAIEHLDAMLVNNTVTVGGLTEDIEVFSGDVQQLQRDFKHLEKQINQTARTSQIQFMETGLEVEAAREVVLRRVGELAGNLSQHNLWLQETDEDVDDLYTLFYKQNSSYMGLKAVVAQLERGVANVTQLANENRLALDSEAGAMQWGGANDWEPLVKALQHDVQQVTASLASETSRTGTLERSLTQLSSSLELGLADVSVLKEADVKLEEGMRRLTAFFNSLLKDGIRHSDVLELLLGEEVFEFLEWPVQDQEAHSIPALKEQLGILQEQLRRHNLSITSLLGQRPEGKEEVPAADEPSSSSHLRLDDWHPDNMKRIKGGASARERQLLLHPAGGHLEHRGDGSDLWNLEKKVEELGLKVLQLEQKLSNASTDREAPPGGLEARLQAEVMWMKRGLEEHLRMFKNVFSNADLLARSDATLELDKLWQMVKNKEGKEKKKGGGAAGGTKEGSGRGGAKHRSRRDSSGVDLAMSDQLDDSLLLVATPPLRVTNGVVYLEASLDRAQCYSGTGTFTAPVDGIYLFVLTLDLRPGPAHMLLRRGSGMTPVPLYRQKVTEAGPVTAASLLQLKEGEGVRAELRGGSWVESEDSLLAVLLLHRTT